VEFCGEKGQKIILEKNVRIFLHPPFRKAGYGPDCICYSWQVEQERIAQNNQGYLVLVINLQY